MIEWSRINELYSEIGADGFDEVVELFLEEVEEVIARLRSDSSRNKLEQDLHFLKGSALNLGFTAFSELCQGGERMAAAGQADDVGLEQILNCYETSKGEFITELPQQIAA